MFFDYYTVTGRDLCSDMEASLDAGYDKPVKPCNPLYYFTELKCVDLSVAGERGLATKIIPTGKLRHDWITAFYAPTSLIKYRSNDKDKESPYLHTKFLHNKMLELKNNQRGG